MASSKIQKEPLLWKLELGTITTDARGYCVIQDDSINPWSYHPIAIWQSTGGSPARQFIESADHDNNRIRFRVLDLDGNPVSNSDIGSVVVALLKTSTLPKYEQ